MAWYDKPTFVGLLKLREFRDQLRKENLHDTSKIPATGLPPLPPAPPRDVRTADGTYNDLNDPRMGCAGARFGRNVPLAQVHPEPEPALLEPNPRLVSLKLMTRDQFKPATILNLLAASWIQFQVHDWFSHGGNEKTNEFKIPIAADDPWHEKPMLIRRTRRDPTRPPGSESAGPPSYVNTETHWWDGSQIYGSDAATMAAVRSGKEGKLRLESTGLLPLDAHGAEVSGVTGNWWVGLSMFHTLFAHEHNAICDRLRKEFPAWSDDQLFYKARLINAALMAKIHTVDWTPGILPHPTTKAALHGNWWGLAGQWLYNLFGRINDSELISGIPGSPTNHHTAPYAMTEEFVAVYRMHPLMPDEFVFQTGDGSRKSETQDLRGVAAKNARRLMESWRLEDLFYSFGRMHPGAITLHNYPKQLQLLTRDDGPAIDLAAVDILRDRERGVPRYNQFRRLFHREPCKTFEEITDNKEWAEELKGVYKNDIESVDLMTGLYAERLPAGFGFSETAFRVFILMASRRLKSDRFITNDFKSDVYTRVGKEWIASNRFKDVLLRHFPGLKPALKGVDNPFAPWKPMKT